MAETGENSMAAQQAVDVSRLKPSFGTATAGGTATAATATVNAAAGVITWPANLTIISNALATLTLTNNKINAGDIVLAILDSAGAAAGSVPTVESVQVSAGQVVIVLSNPTATSPAYVPKVAFLLITQGNPG